MVHENGVLLNGHVGSVFASPETAAATDAWPVREDLWADRSEMSGAPTFTGEEYENMTTETAQPEFGSFEHGGGYAPEFGSFEDTGGFAGEFGVGEYGVGEYGVGEYGVGEYGVGEYGVGEQPTGENPYGEFGVGEYGVGEYGVGEYGVGEYGVGENGLGENGVGEQTTGEYPAGESPFGESPFGEHGAGEFGAYEDTGASPSGSTALEDVSWEDVSWESVHGAGETAYEEATFEVAETVGYEQPYGETIATEQRDLEWPAEVLSAEWTVGGESSASADARFGMTEYNATEYQPEYQPAEYRDAEDPHGEYQTFEHQPFEYQPLEYQPFERQAAEYQPEYQPFEYQPEYQPAEHQTFEYQPAEYLQEDQRAAVSAGQHIVARHPMLTAHRGTQPDLVVRWNAMPADTRTVDVVVHLHGYSGAGAKMRLQDKATASGVDLPTGPSGAGGGGRPTLGLIPRGNFFGGQSGAGYNFPALVQPGAIAQLVASGLQLFQQQTGVAAKRGRLILTGHSGGGAPLNAILRHTDPDEVHLFDGSYGDLANVVAWAKRRIARGATSSALRVLFRPNSGTARHALAVAAALCPTLTASPNAAALHRRFRVEATTVAHNLIPKTFGGRLLADPGADLPGAVPQGCAHGGRPASGGTAPASPVPAGPPAPQPAGGATLTATPDRLAGIVKVSPYTKDGTHALPGAAALATQWRRLTGRPAGTFNARNTAFGTRSLHSEGRAIDCHGRVSVPAQAAQAEAYIRWLIANAVELQVSTIIWNRRIWSWPRRAQGWRNYMTKPNHNPHIDHFHVDLSWEGALHPSPLFGGGITGMAGPGTSPAPPAPRNPAPAQPSRPQPSPSKGPAAPAGAKRSPAEFVRRFGPFARASQARTGVPGLVTLAQAAVESGWGAKAAGHNFFGIKAKASDPADTRQLWRTREVLGRPDVRSFPEVISVTRRPDGRYDYIVRDWFRVFPSPELAFVGHGEFLRRNKRYAPAFAVATDPYRFAAEVAKAGYATDPRYTAVVHSVMRLLERNGWKP